MGNNGYPQDELAGMHLVIDANFDEIGRIKCSNREYMAQYLEDITDVTGMTLVMPPFALKFPYASETHRLIKLLDKENVQTPTFLEFKEHIKKRDTEGQGVSALSMWLESHCALHSWTDIDYISIDLFSCKCYDYKKVLKFTKEYMKLTKLHYTLIIRQLHAPAIIEQGEL